VLALVAVAVLGVGCGSGSDQLRSAVSAMGSTIRTYNTQHASSLQNAGAACGQALAGLNAQSGHISSPPPAQRKRAARALQHAFRLAKAGFADCHRAAQINSYPLMVRANAELADANSWMRRAARLDH
jgi:hypothetical protein